MGETKQLMRFIRNDKGQVLAAAVLGSCTVLCSAGLLGASAVLISKAALMNGMLELMTLVALVRFFGIFRAVFRYGERLISHDVTLKVLANFRTWYYQKLIPLLPAAVGNRAAELFKNILSDIELLQYFYLRVVAAPLVCVITVVIVFLFLLLFVKEAAFLLLFGAVLEGLLLPMALLKRQKQNASEEQAAKQQFYRSAEDFLQGFDAVWFYGLRKKEQAKKSCDAMQQAEKKNKNLQVLLEGIGGLIGALVLIGSFYYASQAVAAGTLQGIYLVMVPLVAWSALEAVKPMPLAIRYWYAANGAMGEMQEMIAQTSKGREEKHLDAPLPWKSEGIVFRNVTFAYETAPILQNFSFTISAGEKAVLIGEIGSGKSSVIQLILGFYRQQQGEIWLDGIPLDALNVAQIGERVAYLSQETALFCASVRENLAYVGDYIEEEMIAALKKANLWEDIAALPGQLDYRLEESGRNLSGGQRKRLALAQIFLQEKPIVILDEPLEGLDAKNRAEIMEQIQKACENKTLLYVTHNADEIKYFDTKIAIGKC